jgi:hypothetical protein
MEPRIVIWLEVNHQQDATQLRNFYYSTYVSSSIDVSGIIKIP